jgi:hypothetical protein
MRSQKELERIWEDIHQCSYGKDPSISKPTILVEDETEHVMSIPNINAIDIEAYSRKLGQPWEIVPYVGEK